MRAFNIAPEYTSDPKLKSPLVQLRKQLYQGVEVSRLFEMLHVFFGGFFWGGWLCTIIFTLNKSQEPLEVERYKVNVRDMAVYSREV